MRVLIVPMDDKGACTFYRVTEPARVAKDLGVQVAVTGTVEVWAELERDGSWTVYEFRHDCDILVLQRPLAQSTYEIARVAKKQGVKIVIELDDYLHGLHASNTMTYWIDPKRFPLHNYEWARRAIALADAFTLSTPALIDVYADGRPAFVVRNRLPERALKARPEMSPAREFIGWTGAINVHPTDLQDTRGALRAVKAPVRMVGNPTGVASALRIPASQLHCASDWIDSIEDYWEAVAGAFGVGIAPLETSRFNRCKSWLKPAEMLTLGIPAVCSPLDEYVALAEQAPGAVTIARGASAWVKALRQLMRDDSVYEHAREAGIEWAEQNTLERHGMDWVDAWSRIMES